ncbi:MAG: hypothetical protein WCF37_08510, partial [Pseudolabrys sp.]
VGAITETRSNRPGSAPFALPFPSSTSPAEDYSLAETTKLSVGQALEKLRGTEAPKAKIARLDEKIDTLDEETQRLRTMRRRLERDQRAGSTGRDVQEANARRVTKSRMLGIMIGIAIVILILAWMWGLFELPTIANKG